MDPDPDPGGPKTCGSGGSGNATLLSSDDTEKPNFALHPPPALQNTCHNSIFTIIRCRQCSNFEDLHYEKYISEEENKMESYFVILQSYTQD
jgi:hypothetical protein